MDYLSTHRTKSDDFSTASLYEEANGKMFGVMVCRRQNGQRGVLHAFSGEWEGRKTPPGWVPSSGFLSEYEAERDRTEAEVDNFKYDILQSNILHSFSHCNWSLHAIFISFLLIKVINNNT